MTNNERMTNDENPKTGVGNFRSFKLPSGNAVQPTNRDGRARLSSARREDLRSSDFACSRRAEDRRALPLAAFVILEFGIRTSGFFPHLSFVIRHFSHVHEN